MKKCHFIGIGGIGMSGLAKLVLEKNVPTSGSDINSNQMTQELEKKGARIFLGHKADRITPDMTVVFSTDIKKENPEYQAAVQLNCALLHRSELLQELIKEKKSLAVAGTHGKTTTSALLAWVLESCGYLPSYAIGGVALQLESNARHGVGEHFVLEACESDRSFLNYTPYGAIVTNIDLDHMDHFGDESMLFEAFKNFIEQVSSEKHLFWCGDDPLLARMQPKGINYGFKETCQLQILQFRQQQWSIYIDIQFNGKIYSAVEVSLAGRHNALNAAAVFGMALALGLEEKAIREALSKFKGVQRRCEKKAEKQGILFLDDYAHHPTELQATLKAIRQAIGERRLVVVYQPHRYTRARDCQGLYRGIFKEADLLFITEIYAAGEQPIPGITHQSIINEIKEDAKQHCEYCERREVASKLANHLRPHDVVISLGAGDITRLSEEILPFLDKKKPKLRVGVIFGGASVEHEVSLLSVKNVLEAMNQDYYEIEKFGVTRQGSWIVDADPEGKSLLDEFEAAPKLSAEVVSRLLGCDIFFPVMHGTYGEDGIVQGFFDLLNKPYVGCNHRSAAISMDKDLTKRLVAKEGIRCLPSISFTKYEWENFQEAFLLEIRNKLSYPLFVKPVHLGSSVGVFRVEEENALQEAILKAFQLDTRLIVENGINNVREIEFSLLGNHEITVYPPGEVHANGSIHDFDSKYGLNPHKAAAKFSLRAAIPPEKVIEGMELAKRAYKAVGCEGMARVDTFLDPEGNLWFNEINPIPGFTKYSLYPLMCIANGLSFSNLIDCLIISGLERRRRLDRLKNERV